ncbi:hypothetical protein J1N35_027606 [Gossypium stocksii]|uniref:Uncharacterized protein n=1 Tax=Gossypium stocksii TaxID=47602 RepID=A0A9D3VBR5_9ROSI|nr:hypothetical protein J1N35_027606 [Gossypium stocksii]
MCITFFLKGKDSAATGARICWQLICSPKAKGGLGLRNLVDWDKTCILHKIRAIVVGEGSL